MRTQRLQLYIGALALIAAAAHLAWEHFHGGVVSHHILNRGDLPAISNWWGAVLLPAWGWFASRSVLQRATTQPHAVLKSTVAFVGSLLFGIALSAAFAGGQETIAFYLFLALLGAGFVLPLYRAEYGFGFVLGMTFVFGAVIPTLVACVAAGISLVLHRLTWPAVAWAFDRLLRRAPAGQKP